MARRVVGDDRPQERDALDALQELVAGDAADAVRVDAREHAAHLRLRQVEPQLADDRLELVNLEHAVVVRERDEGLAQVVARRGRRARHRRRLPQFGRRRRRLVVVRKRVRPPPPPDDPNHRRRRGGHAGGHVHAARHAPRGGHARIRRAASRTRPPPRDVPPCVDRILHLFASSLSRTKILLRIALGTLRVLGPCACRARSCGRAGSYGRCFRALLTPPPALGDCARRDRIDRSCRGEQPRTLASVGHVGTRAEAHVALSRVGHAPLNCCDGVAFVPARWRSMDGASCRREVRQRHGCARVRALSVL